ncbi:AGAP006276-PA, partial [Anopheles gambiae str. PEST]
DGAQHNRPARWSRVPGVQSGRRGQKSNFMDQTAGLAHPVVRRPDVHERRTVRDSAHARLQHVDATDQVCAAPRSRYLRVSTKFPAETHSINPINGPPTDPPTLHVLRDFSLINSISLFHEPEDVSKQTQKKKRRTSNQQQNGVPDA